MFKSQKQPRSVREKSKMSRDPSYRTLKSLIPGASTDLLKQWLEEEWCDYGRLKHRTGPFRAFCKRSITLLEEELSNRGVDVVPFRVKEAPKPRSHRMVRSRAPANAKQRIMYIECKTGRNDRGGARIGRVSFSKTGQTLYYRGLILRSLRGSGISGNFKDVNTKLEYWVSGPKRNGQDRHWAGSGRVSIDADVVDEYWKEIRGCEPPENPFLS
jgi:hypothetical protein